MEILKQFLPTLVCLMVTPLEGAKILLSVPMVPGMHSHIFQMAELGQGLLHKGHDISWLVPNTSHVPNFFLKKPFKKIMYNVDPDNFKDGVKLWSQATQLELDNPSAVGEITKLLTPVISKFHSTLLRDKTMLSEIEEANFDIVIIDNFFLHRNFYLIPAKLGLPYISLVDVMEPWMARAPWMPSHVPHGLLDFSEKMSFMQRLGNVVFNIMWTTLPHLLFDIPIDEDVLKFYADDIPNFTSINALVAESELWLITTNEYIDYVKPMMANMINIGGHNTRPAKELPPDLEKFVGSARDGVILVSFGSGIDTFPDSIIEKFLFVFKQIPQKVVWRLKRKSLKGVTKNVMLMDWLPQNDLLGHRNTKLFITHCGRNGQFESMYHSVPMIAMAVQNEQIYNAKRVIQKGFAVGLDIRTFTPEDLLAAITDVLENPVYAENIAKASEMFKTQQHHPLDVATHWVEHVIKYGGKHLRSHALDMPWYQYLMLDIIAGLSLTLFILSFIVVKILKCLCRVCCRKKVKKD